MTLEMFYGPDRFGLDQVDEILIEGTHRVHATLTPAAVSIQGGGLMVMNAAHDVICRSAGLCSVLDFSMGGRRRGLRTVLGLPESPCPVKPGWFPGSATSCPLAIESPMGGTGPIRRRTYFLADGARGLDDNLGRRSRPVDRHGHRRIVAPTMLSAIPLVRAPALGIAGCSRARRFGSDPGFLRAAATARNSSRHHRVGSARPRNQ